MKKSKKSAAIKVKDLGGKSPKGVKGGLNFTKTMDKSSPTL